MNVVIIRLCRAFETIVKRSQKKSIDLIQISDVKPVKHPFETAGFYPINPERQSAFVDNSDKISNK